MKTRRTLVLSLMLIPGILAPDASAPAQSHASPPAADTAPAPALLREQAAELIAALKDYRASLERLLALHERDLARAIEQRELRRDFYTLGIISRREFEKVERAVAAAQQQVDDARRAIDAADHAMAEATVAETVAALPPLAVGGSQQTAVLVRDQGPAVWSLTVDTPKLQQLFAARFGRPLPVSAFGQTPLHDRMGLDHHNALDVAVHPDSPEGRALMDYLRTAGIPFIASRGAMPGSASGAHIHVGQPSPRITIPR